MKKQIVSTLLALCMLLCLMPTAAFAEESAETPPVCSCETACTAESMNVDCAVCGAEGALPENCAKCAQPADAAAVQPVGEVSDPQPETALTALSGEGETPAASGAVTEVSTADELTAAVDSAVDTVKLTGDISISNSLTVKRTVTLDLNGHVLQMTGNDRDPVIEVKKDSNGVGIGNLTLTDSAPNTAHKFTPNADGLWVLDEVNGTKTVNGGVITGSKEMGIWVDGDYYKPLPQKPAEADCVHLIMTGGNIVGCAAAAGGGVYAGYHAYFTMTGGSIRGCVAKAGGGVCLTNSASFAMGVSALIADCISTDGGSCGGGGIGADLGALVALSENAVIQNCTAQHGGGVYLNGATLTMSGNASVTGCNSIAGGGVSARGDADPQNPYIFTMTGNSSITDCTALNGGGIFVAMHSGKVSLSGSAKIKNCRTVERDGLGFPHVTGGGVHVSSGSFEMSGGSIESCTAVNGGNSVFVCTGGYGKFTMTGGTVDGSITMPYTVGNDTVYMDGLGTAVSPYQISTADQLKLFRDIVNGSNGQKQDRGACAVLMNDIVLNDGTFDENGSYTPGPSGAALTEWSPMGVSNSTAYAGTFDGAGHTIQGLYCNSYRGASGLFGYIAGATIQDIRVTGHFNADSAENSGCIVALAQNSRITGCVSTASINGHHNFQSSTGGIVGIADSSTQVSDCINYGTVKCITSKYYATNAGGIVGWLTGSSNITNCSNFGTVIGLVNGSSTPNGGSTPPIYVGGIVGTTNLGSISDCYNAGAVRINEQSSSSSTQGAGGIAGYAGNDAQHPVQISNCYNVGSVTAANANAMLGGIVGWSGYDSVAITNCYYLTGTARQVYGNGTATVTATTEKSTFDFADGTVLERLKKGTRTGADPWEKECKYLDAAGKTLPVFKGQGDDHTHQSSKWESNKTEHWQVCTCGAVFNKAEHSGGTATCTQKAKCTVCGAEYGNALGHDFTVRKYDNDSHWMKCSRCDEIENKSPHTWDNGKVTTAPTCTKAGETTYTCAVCHATKTDSINATGHSWKSDWASDATHHWHECTNENCDVTDNAGKDGYAKHTGGKATCKDQAVCEICKESYGSPDPNNHTDLKHIDAKAATAAEEGNIAYWYCGGCKKYFSDAAAKAEITEAATVTAKLPPKITAGDGAAVTQGEKNELTFTSDASFADFLRVELDGTTLDEKNYTKREGSTIITLNRDFVATLSVGEHTLSIVSKSGTATAKFTVKAKPAETATQQPTVTPQPTAQPQQTAQPQPTVQSVSPIPSTGDTANPALWFALLIVSGSALAAIFVLRRKANRK